MSLYRKYRPQTFADVVGQNPVVQTLVNAIKNDNVAHAYIFTGSRGTGKTTTARILAKALNCTDRQGAEPCNKCSNCQQITAGSLLDVLELDAASNRGIDEIRELRETIRFQPTTASAKVYIIDEVHMLTKEAFNALLKTLEEPPAYVYFVLATTELEKIPPTIISRCQRFDFKRLPKPDLIEMLKNVCEQEKLTADAEALALIADEAMGGARDALSLLEQLTTNDNDLTANGVKKLLGHSDDQQVANFLTALKENDTLEAINVIKQLEMDGVNCKHFYEQSLIQLRRNYYTALQQNSATNWELKVLQKLEENYQLFRTSDQPFLAFEVLAGLLCEKEVTTQAIVEAEVASVPKIIQQEPVVSVPREVLQAPEPTISETKPEPELESEPKQQVPEKKPPMQKAAVGGVSLAMLQKDWPKIVERISSASVRISAKQVSVWSLDPDTLTLAFGSQFLKEQLTTVQALNELENAVYDYTGARLQIKPHNEIVTDQDSESKQKASSFVDSALDLFNDL